MAPDRSASAIWRTALQAAGVDHQIDADIQRDIWEKMVLAATFAVLTALMRLPIGPLRENAGPRVMSRAALDEAHAVARA